jgi:hypothetical protein
MLESILYGNIGSLWLALCRRFPHTTLVSIFADEEDLGIFVV